MSIQSEIGLSIHRSLILLNKCKNISFKIPLIIILVISFIYYTPELFSYYITSESICKNVDNYTIIQIKYKKVATNFGLSYPSKIINITLSSVRIILGIVVLTIVNIFNVVIFNIKSLKPFNNANNHLNTKSSKSFLEYKFYLIYLLHF